jgi:hypothetical protein
VANGGVIQTRPSRIQIILAVIVVLWIADVALLGYVRRNPRPWPPQEPLPLYSAYAGQHCTAKGDGAFEVSITLTQRDVIVISIEQAPTFESAVTFSFPGGILKRHEAVLAGADGKQEQLTGKVEFSRAVMSIPMTGRFNLETTGGKRFIGKFTAEWGDLVMNCDLMK